MTDETDLKASLVLADELNAQAKKLNGIVAAFKREAKEVGVLAIKLGAVVSTRKVEKAKELRAVAADFNDMGERLDGLVAEMGAHRAEINTMSAALNALSRTPQTPAKERQKILEEAKKIIEGTKEIIANTKEIDAVAKERKKVFKLVRGFAGEDRQQHPDAQRRNKNRKARRKQKYRKK